MVRAGVAAGSMHRDSDLGFRRELARGPPFRVGKMYRHASKVSGGRE